MPPTRGRVYWTSEELIHSLFWFRDAVENSVQEIVENFAPEAQQYLKDEAPWEDRTGAAREGLTATPYHRETVSGIELAHGVSYGIFLELRFGGRDAIIIPSTMVLGRELMERVANETFERAERKLP